ncbi:MAG: dihydropteroate synthase [Spirochaetales bacterium]|nr:dihydropteroate synthase [Spirochaetales bacterium]
MPDSRFFPDDSFRKSLPDLFTGNEKNVYIMGILNCTDNSFYEGSRYSNNADAVDAALAMIDNGADIIDIGGESTRPGSEPVTQADEIKRTMPVIAAIRKKSSVLISIDTCRAETAKVAIEEGANIINDVTALQADKGMAGMAAAYKVPVVLMHMQGTPKTMQQNPHYTNCIQEIMQFLKSRMHFAIENGINEQNIIIDPGIGFGKRLEDNLTILKKLDEFTKLGRPVLIGLSRKSFIGTVLDNQVQERLAATLAANIYSVFHGARILRVHDVKETVDSINIIEAIERN